MTNSGTGRRACLAALTLLLTAALEAQEIKVRGRLLDAAGRGLSDADVVLYPAVGCAEAGNLQLEGRYLPPATARVRPDDSGEFRLGAPGVGLWSLKVRVSGGVVLTSRLPLVQSVDLGEVTVPRLRDLTVHVVDERGLGIAGFPLVTGARHKSPDLPNLLPARLGETRWVLDNQRTVTDAEGRAALPIVEAGFLHVVGGIQAGRFVYAEIDSHPGPAVELTVRSLDSGRIVDAEGRPAAGVLVFIRDPFDPHPFMTAGRSGAGGEVALPVSPELLFPERFKAFGLSGGGEVMRPTPHKLSFAGVDGVALGDLRQADDGFVVRLRTVPRVAGHVIDQRTGKPLPGTLVSTQDASTRTDAQGAFALPTQRSMWHPRPVFFSRRGYQPGVATASGDPERDHELTVGLEPAVSLAGSVVGSDGRGIAGATVRAQEAHGRFRGFTAAEARTDGEGRFELEGLVPEKVYRVKALRTGYAPSSVDVASSASAAGEDGPRIVLEPGGEAEIPAPDRERQGAAESVASSPGVRVVGRVVDAEGRPLAGAEVRGSFQPPRTVLETDDDGRFEIGDQPSGSKLRLHVSLDGYQRVSGAFTVGEPLEIVLRKGWVIRGHVADADGKPVPDTMVNLRRRRGMGASQLADEDGRFTFARNGPGAVTVKAEAPGGFVAEPVEILLGTRREEEVELVLRPGAVLRGRVLDATGRAVADAQANVEPYDPEKKPADFPFSDFSSLRTDGAGRFFFQQGLVPGTYVVGGGHSEFENVARVRNHFSAGVHQVDLVLGQRMESALIRGRVIGEDGRGVGDAAIWFQ